MKIRKLLTMTLILSMMSMSTTSVFAAAKPSKVTRVKASATTNSITVSWAKAKNAKKYQVRYRAGNSSYKYVNTSARKATIKKLKAETKYSINVRAKNDSKNGTWSAVKVIATKKVNNVKPDNKPGTDEGNKPSPNPDENTKPTPKPDEDTKPTPKPDENNKPSKEPDFPVLKNIELPYSANNGTPTTIYVGQTWSNELYNKLKEGSSGDMHWTRSNYASFWGQNETGEWDIWYRNAEIYLFDTGDYDNFLEVTVASNQIVKWETNADIVARINGVNYKYLYSTRAEMKDAIHKASTSGEVNEPGFSGYPLERSNATKAEREKYGIGAILFGGVNTSLGEDVNEYYDCYEEHLCGMHYVNAYRVKFVGKRPFKYSRLLEGDDTYGTRAMALTLAMNFADGNGLFTHDTDEMTAGPLAGMDMNYRNNELTSQKTNGQMFGSGENICDGAWSGLGEYGLYAFMNSGPHMSLLRDEDKHYSDDYFAMATAVYKGKGSLVVHTGYPLNKKQ